MKLSQGDRIALISRVEQQLGGRAVNRGAIEWAVDQVLARLALPDESSSTDDVLFALSAESMPDLASRVRQKLLLDGAEPLESGTATVGRFTVVTMRMGAERQSQLDRVARELGARLSVIQRSAAGVTHS